MIRVLDNANALAYIVVMFAQNQISRTLSDAAAQARIAGILSQESFVSRHAVGRRLCDEFGFFDARGRAQLAGCLKALAALEARSEGITLPVARPPAVRPGPHVLATPVPPVQGVPGRLEEIEGLEVVQVGSRAERRTWNTLIAHEHPQGITTFAGCQIYYLVRSAHGILAAAGFSAAALRLAVRDRWMNWSEGQRQAHLHRVVGLNRFLIRPGVVCAHFASHVLGRVLRRLPRDFEARYGYRPWLVETFVSPPWSGRSLLAANFLRLGQTAGRGRQDVGNSRATVPKWVYVYELDRKWRRRLGVDFVDHAPSLRLGEGLSRADWAGNEFGGARLGNRRRSDRLVKSASLLAEYPGQAICGNGRSDRAAVDGFYRFIEKAAEHGIDVDAILAPHRERSTRRMRSQRTVLAIQDGTDLNFSGRPGCEGLGVIGHNQTSARTPGLHLHATLAVTGSGLPLGVLRCEFEAPPGGRKKPGQLPKSHRWLRGFDDTLAAADGLTGRTRVIAVMDREADCFLLFDHQRRHRRVDLLVRARHDRCLDGSTKLFAALRSKPVEGSIDIDIDRITPRQKSGKAIRAGRSARMARCNLQYGSFLLAATIKEARPLTLQAVQVTETDPPEDEDPVKWTLLTSLPVDSAEAAREVIGFYLNRWKIEDYFRILKSGCRVEYLAFRTADRLTCAIAINAVIAWRIQLMTLLGREAPHNDPHLMFTDEEITFLRDYARAYGQPPPENLGAAVHLVAMFGGYQARKHDPEPGAQIMWRGQERLSAATIAYEVKAMVEAQDTLFCENNS